MRVRIADIKVPEGRRQLRGLDELVESIRTVGLLNPITLTEDLRLVAGYHRLEACKRLGWSEIDATIITVNELDAELAEIDENLIRNELTQLERAEALARRKELYEAKYPEAKRGTAGAIGSNKSQGRKIDASETVSFAIDTAAKTGLTPRTIQQDVQIATKIVPDVRDAIRDTPLADSKRDLLELARMEPEQQRQVAARLIRGEAAKVRLAAQLVRREMTPPPLPQGKFRTIYADPPWPFDDTATRGAAENHYPTMSIAEICALPVSDLAADDAHLYLWTTNSHLHDAFHVVAAWGFEYKTLITWVKPQIGLGHYFRGATEHILFCVRGNLPMSQVGERNWFEAPRQEHSRKPAFFYELVERCSPGPRLELFARTKRAGWVAWGNEVGGRA